MGTMERRIRREILDPDRPLSRSSPRSAQRRLPLRLIQLKRPRFQRPPRSEEAFPCRSLCFFALFFSLVFNERQIGRWANFICRVYLTSLGAAEFLLEWRVIVPLVIQRGDVLWVTCRNVRGQACPKRNLVGA